MSESPSVNISTLDVPGVLRMTTERERSIASSPSGSSMVSEVDLDSSSTRQSPFTSMLAHSSPSSPSLFPSFIAQRPVEFSGVPQDSECSSRSSADGSQQLSREKLCDSLEKYRRRKRSSDSSDSSESPEGSDAVVGGLTASCIGGEDEKSDSGSRPASRKHSTREPPIRPVDVPRGRVANIRRESSSGANDEMAHERLVKASQHISSSFDDFRIEEVPLPTDEQRKRTMSSSSLTEPISILTSAFLPHSCSPSPTRVSDSHKQCYSPSTQQIVRPNIPYSPSPSPTQSPTRKRLMSTRSQSPIASRPLKRRAEQSSGGGGMASLASNQSSSSATEAKRVCNYALNSTSPLVLDSRPFSYPLVASTSSGSLTCPSPSHSDHGSCGGATSSSQSLSLERFYPRRPSPFLVDPEIRRASFSVDSYSDLDRNSNRGEDCDSLSEPSSVLMPQLEENLMSLEGEPASAANSESFIISSLHDGSSTPNNCSEPDAESWTFRAPSTVPTTVALTADFRRAPVTPLPEIRTESEDERADERMEDDLLEETIDEK